MSEVKTELKTFRNTYTCDSCRKGEMQYITPDVIVAVYGTASANRHMHQCDNCSVTVELPRAFPYLSYEVVEPNEVKDT